MRPKPTATKSALPCSNCHMILSPELFSKQQIRRRNPRNLLCFPCLGRPTPSTDPGSESSTVHKNVSSKHATHRRECAECGKFLTRDRYSKTQWSKATGGRSGECRACIDKKEQEAYVACERCRRLTACRGFRLCRECNASTCRVCGGSDFRKDGLCLRCLPAGVRHERPNFRIAADPVVFDRRPIAALDAIGEYDVVYLSVEGDGGWDVSSTARGTLRIAQRGCHRDMWDGRDGPDIVGSFFLRHPSFQEKVELVEEFKFLNSSFVREGRLPRNTFSKEAESFFWGNIHEVAPETTWHDPLGDLYTRHTPRRPDLLSPDHCFPGKMKVLRTTVALPLVLPGDGRNERYCRRKAIHLANADKRVDEYMNVSNYWLCRRLGIPEDAGYLIRQYVCPLPVLYLMTGDLFLVTATKDRHGDCAEVIVVGRKVRE